MLQVGIAISAQGFVEIEVASMIWPPGVFFVGDSLFGQNMPRRMLLWSETIRIIFRKQGGGNVQVP